MTLPASLMADILERPLDDGPRLVAADALQEKGDPRGMFITAQCRLAESGVPRGERAELHAQVEKLLAKHQATFAGAAKDVTHRLRRGFVDEVVATSSALEEVGKQLFSTQPVTTLTITRASAKGLATLAEAGVFARVLRLTIRGTLKDAGARTLAGALAERKTPLLTLNVGSTEIGAAGVAALGAVLSGCTALALTGNPIGDEGLEVLANLSKLATLETLYLTDTGVTDEGMGTLAEARGLVGLVRLGVARNEEVTEEGLRALARSKSLKRLAWLEYSDEDGLQEVATRERAS